MLAKSLLDDPDFLPFKLDLVQQRLLLVRLSAQQRADAAFLDERALPRDAQAFWIPLGQIPKAPAVPSACPDFIFHIGHCGSTLLSRLLQSWPSVQVLREPLPLRTVAEGQASGSANWQEWLPLLLEQWATPQAPHGRVLVKATSSCNGLIEPIMSLGPTARAVLLDMPLEPYLATLFKSEGSIRDAAVAAPARWSVLASATGNDLPAQQALDYPQMCAMGWLAEQLRFSALAAGPDRLRIIRLNFHDLLSSPRDAIGAVARHLQLDAVFLEQALASSDWNRYSKVLAHAYDAGDRAHDLALARQRFGPQIDAGRGWVQAFLDSHPRLAVADLRFD